jgi:hypothetical protein
VTSYAIFGIGIGNLGRSRGPRRSTSAWRQMLNAELQAGDPPVHIIQSFGHTGNFLADSPSTCLAEVTARFHRLLGTDWVVRPVSDVRAALTALAGALAPSTEEDARWTPGLAFHAGRGVEGSIAPTARAVLWKITPWMVGVWKRDSLTPEGRLDPDRRTGGWGGISHDIARQLGGQWTARSRRTLAGLIRILEGPDAT